MHGELVALGFVCAGAYIYIYIYIRIKSEYQTQYTASNMHITLHRKKKKEIANYNVFLLMFCKLQLKRSINSNRENQETLNLPKGKHKKIHNQTKKVTIH